MAGAPIEEVIVTLAEATQVIWRGQTYTGVYNGTTFLWPDPWQDVWHDRPIGL